MNRALPDTESTSSHRPLSGRVATAPNSTTMPATLINSDWIATAANVRRIPVEDGGGDTLLRATDDPEEVTDFRLTWSENN